MNQCSIDQIMSDLEEIEELAKGSLEEKAIIACCKNIKSEIIWSINFNQEV